MQNFKRPIIAFVIGGIIVTTIVTLDDKKDNTVTTKITEEQDYSVNAGVTEKLANIINNFNNIEVEIEENDIVEVGEAEEDVTNLDYEKGYTSTSVNIRSEANTDSEIIDTLSVNTKIGYVKYNKDDEWTRVRYKETYGWICTKYISDKKIKIDTGLKAVFGYNPTSQEIELVKRIAMHEAGNTEPHEGIVALMACIANRVKDSGCPNTITGVAYQSGQMTCVTDGSIWNYSINNKVEAAWDDFINGGYARHPEIIFWASNGYISCGRRAYQIGGHYFSYRRS